jgi:glutamate racemase
MMGGPSIGVFDSGIGGLSILRALRRALPHERFVYFADTLYNPYGVKPLSFVRERTLAVAQELLAQHQIKALVVACNTATAAAIQDLRQTYPQLPLVGIEPALKPAAAATRNGRVLVLATRGTIESEKFAQLKSQVLAAQPADRPALSLCCVPCDGLADRIELLSRRSERLQDATDLIAMCADFIRAGAHFFSNDAAFDTLVLGCTHYPLIRDAFQALVGPQVMIIDNAEPVAKRTRAVLGDRLAHSPPNHAMVWQSSAHTDDLVAAARYWNVA